MATILCVDDEPAAGAVLTHTLTTMGHRPILVASVDEAMAVVRRTALDLILADFRMPRLTGLDLLRMLKAEGYGVPVIIMTGYSSIEHAVVSIKSGAIDYLTKPVQAETLEIAVTQALEVVRLRRENESFRQEIARMKGARTLIGESEPFRRVMETIRAVADTRATVLLEGESGTGKELFARAIHEQSSRAAGPLVAVNCAALPEGLVESALFGHEKGAFTGATARSAGAFERAHGGTILLDEVSEMRLDLQAKLLRVLQEQEFERVGGTEPIQVDVRVVATTNRDLRAQVADGTFRSDLFYRLNVVPIRTPPVRERADDIPRLVHHFAGMTADRLGVEVPAITPDAMRLLQAYSWPGNVRELANAVERAMILARGGPLVPELFTDHFAGVAATPPSTGGRDHAAGTPAAGPADVPFSMPPSYSLDELERIGIERALAATAGNRTRAAKLLGISERTLRKKLNTPAAPTRRTDS